MIDLDTLKSKLRRKRPHRVVGTLPNGDDETFSIPKGTNRWVNCVKQIASLRVRKVRLYDEDKGLIESIELEPYPDTEVVVVDIGTGTSETSSPETKTEPAPSLDLDALDRMKFTGREWAAIMMLARSESFWIVEQSKQMVALQADISAKRATLQNDLISKFMKAQDNTLERTNEAAAAMIEAAQTRQSAVDEIFAEAIAEHGAPLIQQILMGVTSGLKKS